MNIDDLKEQNVGIELDLELFCKVEGLPKEIVFDLKIVDALEAQYYDLEDEMYCLIDLAEFVLSAKTLVTDMFIASGNGLDNSWVCYFQSKQEDCEECGEPLPIKSFVSSNEVYAIILAMNWYINKDKQ